MTHEPTTAKIVLEVSVILVLIVINSLLALAETTLVSANRLRLEQLMEQGSRGAATALRLAKDPSSFLAAIQIGITGISVVAGAFGGMTLALGFERTLDRWFPALESANEAISVAIIVGAITYVSIVIGELIPKRIAIGNPENMAVKFAPAIELFCRFTRPAVWFLRASSDFLLDLVGYRAPVVPVVTEDEVRSLVEQGTEAGVFAEHEETMIKRVLELDDLRASDLMTPRPAIIALDVNDPAEENMTKVVASNHSYFPLLDGDWDHPLGVISVKRLLARYVEGSRPNLRDCAVETPFIPESLSVANALQRFADSGAHLALVVDEYGTMTGMLTMIDIATAITGASTVRGQAEAKARQRRDGSWLVDGLMPMHQFLDTMEIDPDSVQEAPQSVGGLVMAEIGRIPAEGDQFSWRGLRFEVVDMDRHRVDKVLIHRLDEAADLSDKSINYPE